MRVAALRPREVGAYVVLGLLALGAGLAVPTLFTVVRDMGRHIPRPDVRLDYGVAVLWAAALLAGLLLLPLPRGDRRPLVMLWLAKCAVTLGFMLLYEAVYPALDSYGYLREASLPSVAWQETGLGKGTANTVALVWLHARLITPSYHAMKVTFALVGLLGVYVFYRGIVRATGIADTRILYFLGLFPSVLFWSSILGKDPVNLFGVCLYAYGVMSWSRTRRAGFLVPAAIGIWIATMIRVWAGPILLLPLVVFAVGGIRGAPRKILFVTVVVVAMGATVSRFLEVFGLETAQDLYQTTESVSRAWAEGGSGQTVAVSFTGWGSMVAFAPKGAFTALFRPLPGEVMNPFGLLAGLENAFLLLMTGAAIARTRLATLRQPLLLWALVLIGVWAGVYGFISYQNLGSAVRFRLQILPLMLGVLLYLARRDPPPLAAAERPEDSPGPPNHSDPIDVRTRGILRS